VGKSIRTEIRRSFLDWLTAIALQTLAYETGIPRDVLQVVLVDRDSTPEVGHAFCTHPAVAKVSFTVRRLLLVRRSWGGTVGRFRNFRWNWQATILLLVFEDADLEQALTAAWLPNFEMLGKLVRRPIGFWFMKVCTKFPMSVYVIKGLF
jgi:acyl-CoA reductase-like NAD-dependent aldehyde dehydrogenase